MITEIRNGFNVKRFHTAPRTQEETVGHHSAGVAVILLRLDPDCSRNLLIAALMHDVPECYTGDVPAPFKWDVPDMTTYINIAEAEYMEENGIPEPELTPLERRLLKVADMLDLVLSSLEEIGRGNLYAKHMVQAGQDYIEGMGLGYELQAMCETMVMEVKDQWALTINK